MTGQTVISRPIVTGKEGFLREPCHGYYRSKVPSGNKLPFGQKNIHE